MNSITKFEYFNDEPYNNQNDNNQNNSQNNNNSSEKISINEKNKTKGKMHSTKNIMAFTAIDDDRFCVSQKKIKTYTQS